MSSAPDDLPWPELGNVTRGATRGNQGQKGVLGEIGPDGCALLQLRVQPGVLAVRLNRHATEWYKILDAEVNRALKLTKTYWRKARRRQDYDARADQDHMELHEWLQQLKDKTMSHLELLMQKGDIQGPPYNMPDDVELTFLRKFIERQATGIPHNPRLRNGNVADVTYVLRDQSVGSVSPEPEEHSYVDPTVRRMPVETPDQSLLLPPRNSVSPSLRTPESLTREANQTKQALALSRAALSRAQRETQEAFLRYTACLDAEKQARQSVTAAEKRRDDIMTALLSMNQSIFEQQSRHSSVSIDDHQTRYHTENPNDLKHRAKPLEWTDHDPQNVFTPDAMTQLEISHRKHRTWDNSGLEGQYGCEDMMPQRKRLHMIPGYDVLTPVLQAQNLGLQS